MNLLYCIISLIFFSTILRDGIIVAMMVFVIVIVAIKASVAIAIATATAAAAAANCDEVMTMMPYFW